MTAMDGGVQALIASIVSDLRRRGSAVVAFSGGVDSGVVAALAHRALGPGAVAVTAVAESLAGRELEQARRLAAEIGISHETVTTSDLTDPEFTSNPAYRCYVCQGRRMGSLVHLARQRGYAVVCDGTNAADPGPERPGLAAVRERGIFSPLLVHGADKVAVRAMARALGLSVWDRPANACLSSRIPHGQEVTWRKLRRVEAAEELLFARGFRVVRVRHDGAAARVEVGREELPRLAGRWEELAEGLRQLGFREVSYDPAGYRSGGADRPPAPRPVAGPGA